MSRGTKFKATFSNGEIRERSSLSRHYTHAWLSIGRSEARVVNGHAFLAGGWRLHGFSTSREQAARNMETETRFRQGDGHILVFSEIVELEIIGAKVPA